MAMIDDILNQLTTMGLGSSGGYMGISGITPDQISTAMLGLYPDLQPGDLPSSLFQPISSDLIRGGLAGTYSPQIEATGQSLLGNMLTDIGGKKGRQAYGGFSGSGQQQQFTGGIKDVYGKGMTDVLTQTGQQKAQSLQSIQDMINQWQSQALQIKGYQ